MIHLPAAAATTKCASAGAGPGRTEGRSWSVPGSRSSRAILLLPGLLILTATGLLSLRVACRCRDVQVIVEGMSAVAEWVSGRSAVRLSQG